MFSVVECLPVISWAGIKCCFNSHVRCLPIGLLFLHFADNSPDIYHYKSYPSLIHLPPIILLEIAHFINYAKTRDVYAGYRKAGYSKKYLAEHEGDILLHKAAKKAFDNLGVKNLPSVKSLQEEYAKLLAEKKAAYAEYRRSRDEMRELLLHKQNVDRMLGKDERSEEKKKEHDRQ